MYISFESEATGTNRERNQQELNRSSLQLVVVVVLQQHALGVRMHTQWVLVLLVILLAPLVGFSQAAPPNRSTPAGAHAGVLYAAASSRQARVQLGASQGVRVDNGPIRLQQYLAVTGVAGTPAIISCNGPHAFIVR